MQIINVLPNLPNQIQLTSLNNKPINIRFLYNTLINQWFFDLLSSDKLLPIVTGVGISCGVNLLQPFPNIAQTYGAIICEDFGNTGYAPILSSWGLTHNLLSLSVQEYATA